MAINSRISLLLDNNPTIIWEEVPTATRYTIKIVRKDDPGIPIVDKTVCVSELRRDDGFLKFMYPSTAPRLEPLVHYEFTGETDDGKTASGDLMFLDSIRLEMDELLESIKDRKVVTNPQFENKIISTIEAILFPIRRSISSGPQPWVIPPNCLPFSFS